jgi:TPR repeat protein
VPHNDSIAGALFDRACDANEFSGCVALGVMFENGIGRPQNYGRAASLYRTACEDRNGEGCFRIAGLYEKGAVYGDPERAMVMMRRACQYGYADACTRMKRS